MKINKKIQWTITRWKWNAKRRKDFRKGKRRKKAAIKLANQRTELSNKRHYVLPGGENNYVVFNRRQILAANKILPKGAQRNFYDILKEAVYITK